MRTLLNNNRMSRRSAVALRQHERHPRIALNRYALAQTVTLANISTDCSGVAHSPPTRSIFVIKNSTNAIYEYSETGTWLRTITTTGFADCEGICWMYDDYFAISEEDTSSIVIVRIQPGTASLTKAGGTTVNTGLGNLDANTGGGFEGVSYDPENHKFYVVKERQSTAPTRNGMRVYEVLMNGLAREIYSASAKLPASVTDLADLFYDRFSKHLFLLSQENESIIETDLSGTVFGISTLPGPMTQAEGITFSADRQTMWLVGEPNQMRRFTLF
jgi:uncharacterized protein YjiK